jgi:rubrerythrin
MANIFDDLVGGITKEVAKVQSKSQEMLRIYNLNSQVHELERRKTAKLLEIGRLMCDKYQRSKDIHDDLIKDKVEEIADIEAEVVSVQAQIDAVKLQNDPNVPNSQKTQAKAGYTATPGFECPSCHAPASKDKSFCPSCGEPLKDSDVIDVEPHAGP